MILKDGRLDVLPEEREKEPVEARKEPAEVRTPHMAIEIVDKPVDKEMPVQPQERICTVPEKEGLQSESREEKAKRLQWILQQLIREAVRENNQDLCRELKESMVKELDYQSAAEKSGKRRETADWNSAARSTIRRWTSCCGKRPGDNCGNSRKRREGRKWKKSPQRSQTKKIPAGKLRQKKRKGISFSEMPSPGYVLNQELILCDSTNRALTAQEPQLMHLSASISNFPSPMLIAPTGHCASQAPHATQASPITNAIIFSSYLRVSNLLFDTNLSI